MSINGQTVLTVVNTMPARFNNVKVFAADPWYDPVDGIIKNLVLKTMDDHVCVCRASKCGAVGMDVIVDKY